MPGILQAGQQEIVLLTGRRRVTVRSLRRRVRQTCAEGAASTETDPETNRCNVPHGTWARIERCTSSQSTCRRGEEDSHRTARDCKRSRPKEGEDEVGDDEFLRLYCSPRCRAGREKSLARSIGHAPRGCTDASRTKARGQTGNVQQHGSRPLVWNAAQPRSCNASVLHLASHLASSPVPVFGGSSARLLGTQGSRTVHSSGFEGSAPEPDLEETSEISPAARLTVTPRCSNLLAQLLSQTRSGAEPRQKPTTSRQGPGGHREDGCRLLRTAFHPSVCVVLLAADVLPEGGGAKGKGSRFEDLINQHRDKFVLKRDGQELCFKFQDEKCTDQGCVRAQVCAVCGRNTSWKQTRCAWSSTETYLRCRTRLGSQR